MSEITDSDRQLLNRYNRHHAEDAFAEIVRRHLALVHSAALRQVRSPQLAEEVAQSVFTDLAHQSQSLTPDTVLTGWLYQVTRRTAIDVVRREARRQLREQIATEMNAMHATDADWTHIEPLLDEAMHALVETDRAAVLLRYFENKSLREVGAALGTSDDTAQKRVSRAVERLREFFAQRGVTVGASGLVVVISTNAVQAAPAGLANPIAMTALKGSAVTASTLTLIKTTLKIMAWTKAKTAAVTVVIILLVLGTATILVKQTVNKNLQRSAAAAAMGKVQQASTGLPEAQVQAKTLIFSAMAQRRIPDAANWCETLNAKGKLWPVTPTNIAFAINSQVAGRAYSKKELSTGSIPGKTVVFFETANLGWNQAGGAELLPANAQAVAVAFADGTALIVVAGEMSTLRWTP